MELSKDIDFERVLQIEEEYIRRITSEIISFKPDLVFTEKGISGHLFSIHCQSLFS